MLSEEQELNRLESVNKPFLRSKSLQMKGKK